MADTRTPDARTRSEPGALFSLRSRRTRRRRRIAGTTPLPPPFTNILCAVDGSRSSAEAVRQAVALCGPATALGFVAVTNTVGQDLSAQADLSEQRARAALDDAAGCAKQAGIRALTGLRRSARVSDQLLAESADHDLLAIGCHGATRLGGMMLGSTATQIAHRAETPLLIARRSIDGDQFPTDILLATDGSPGSWAAARTAARLARARASALRMVYVPDGHPERYRELFKQQSAIERMIGSPPDFVDVPGEPARRIVEAAQAGQSSLIVTSKRGLRGVEALGSVSERIVHRAPCSVLVIPSAPALEALD